MLGNLIGGFIVLIVGVSLLPMIAQELDNAINCNVTTNISHEQPIGSTDSFGGGGGQFGGYDGKVKKSWVSNVADYSIVKSNSSIINPDCKPLSNINKELITLVPIFFVLAIIICVFGVIGSSLKNVGMI